MATGCTFPRARLVRSDAVNDVSSSARSTVRVLGEGLGFAERRVRSAVHVAPGAVLGLRARFTVPRRFRIVPHLGHGSGDHVVVRGRVVDSDEPAGAVEGEGPGAAVRRTVSRFLTRGLPAVPLRIRAGSVVVETSTDARGYFERAIEPGHLAGDAAWTTVDVELARPYRGVTGRHTTQAQVRVPGPRTTFGVISDVDDTVLLTGAQRAGEMIARTLTGSFLTRTPMPGAPELYRSLADGRTGRDENPIFYVSSSPWNLHGFLTSFLAHRAFPSGPLLLRDWQDAEHGRGHGAAKHRSITEILQLHPEIAFVLLGDSGQEDPRIYADVIRAHPGRVLAVYIREVRLDPGDGRVERVIDGRDDDVPFVLAADSAAIAAHATGLGLLRGPPPGPDDAPAAPPEHRPRGSTMRSTSALETVEEVRS